MASQSPSSAAALASGLSGAKSYLEGWAALSKLMDQGTSWSGHERNCAFLNLGAERFVDVSAVSGLDFDDDGRASVATDLDGDGDLDLVLKNRTGPQLRFLRNDLGTGRTLLLRLSDAALNHDAIGARVEVLAGARRLVRVVTAGDGYLGQASRWLHFGLAGVPKIDRITVRWPDGANEEFAPPEALGRHVAVRGTGRLAPRAETVRRPLADPTPLLPMPTSDAVVLREPLPLPPTLAKVAFRGQKPERPVLLGCWAQWCEPCTREIAAWAAEHRGLQDAGLDIVLLGFDEAVDQAKAALRFQELTNAHPGAEVVMRQRPASAAAKKAIEALLATITGLDQTPLPTAMLIDTNGCIQVVYLGAAEVDTLTEHTARFGRGQLAGPLRSVRGGQWAFEVKRALSPLQRAFAQRELPLDAAFYERLDSQRNAGGPK